MTMDRHALLITLYLRFVTIGKREVGRRFSATRLMPT